jgi:hypothetical protein
MHWTRLVPITRVKAGRCEYCGTDSTTCGSWRLKTRSTISNDVPLKRRDIQRARQIRRIQVWAEDTTATAVGGRWRHGHRARNSVADLLSARVLALKRVAARALLAGKDLQTFSRAARDGGMHWPVHTSVFQRWVVKHGLQRNLHC